MTGIGTPFQEDVDSKNYFPGAEAEKILSRLSSMLQKKRCFVVLTGEEGVGKTMLCMRLAMEEELYDTILFTETVESFGDVVGFIAQCLEIETDENISMEALIKAIIDELKKNERPLLIVFDQAEHIYLATLERIRKLIDLLQSSGCLVHALFSGRMAFSENYAQLVAIDYDESSADFFELGPLSAEETASYLYSTIEKNPELGQRAQGVFTPDVAATIYDATEGNFRQINHLATEFLENKKSSASFVEELKSTDQEVERRERIFSRSYGRRRVADWSENLIHCGQQLFNDKKALGLLGGIFVAALFVVWFLSGSEQNSVVLPEQNAENKVQIAATDNNSTDEKKETEGENNTQEKPAVIDVTEGEEQALELNGQDEVVPLDDGDEIVAEQPINDLGEQDLTPIPSVIAIKSRPSKLKKNGVMESVETPTEVMMANGQAVNQSLNSSDGTAFDEVLHIEADKHKKKK